MTRYLEKVLIILFLLLSMSGCGGGTSGSDGGTPVKLRGSIQGTTGESVAQALVTILETGDSTLSNDHGEFIFGTVSVSSDITLMIEYQGAEARVLIESIPSEQSLITVELTFDSALGSASITSVSVERIGTPETPSASATPAPTTDRNDEDTDSTQSVLRGVVYGADGLALSGVVLHIPGTRARQVAGSDGRFILAFPTKRRTLTLQAEYQGFKVTLNIGGLPEYAVEVSVRIQLQVEQKSGPNNVDDKARLMGQVLSTKITKRPGSSAES